MSNNSNFFLLIVSLCFIMSCSSKSSMTVEEFEASLLDHGYTQNMDFNTNADREIQELIKEKKHVPMYIDETSKNYIDYKINYKYYFIGFSDEMINKYVVVKIWGINKDNEYVCKGYEKKNVNNLKGKRYRLNQTLKDFDGKIITNPTLYLWD